MVVWKTRTAASGTIANSFTLRLQLGSEETNMRTLLSTIIAIAVVTPALTADEFYIVRNATTKRCTIVNQRPTLSTTTIVGDGTVYTTREKADTAMRTAKICVGRIGPLRER